MQICEAYLIIFPTYLIIKLSFLQAMPACLRTNHRPEKTYQGTLGTQRWTLIRSRTSHGPSMDPTGPLKWTSKLWSHFQARFAISTSYTLCNHSNHVGTLFWSLLISTKAQWTLLDLHGPLNGPQNGPCEANFRGPSH